MNDNLKSSNDQGSDHLISSHLEWPIIINKILTKQLWIFAVRISWTPSPEKLPIIGEMGEIGAIGHQRLAKWPITWKTDKRKSTFRQKPICWYFNVFFCSPMFSTLDCSSWVPYKQQHSHIQTEKELINQIIDYYQKE